MNTATPSAARSSGGQLYRSLVQRAVRPLRARVLEPRCLVMPECDDLERCDRHVGRRHLDLGVGTGWYRRRRWPVEQYAIPRST